MSSGIVRQALPAVAMVKAMALEELRDQSILAARQLAAEMKGRIIESDEDAATVSDVLASMRDGVKILRKKRDGLLQPLDERCDVIRHEFQVVEDTIAEAGRYAKEALEIYMAKKEREAREARLKLEREARELSERSAREAGPDRSPPPLELPPPEPPPSVIQGSKSTSYLTTRVEVEVVDWHAVAAYDPGLLKLDEMRAKAAFRHDEVEGRASEGEVYHGMIFRREKHIANKR